ncbi:MAG: phospholipid carrier-dependent glycosyltransferase, partial [Chitinophagia bacterium]|nr:phospholipid carrier-dependent glycosyltransferase [Chitinophagia bacterium]
MQVVSMKIFGINEYAARFPNAVCGVVTLLVIYSIGKRLHDAKFAAWWVVLYVSSFLPHIYFKSGIIDPWFNLFIFLGIYFLAVFLQSDPTSKRKVNLVLSGLFTGLAILTKGPVGLLIVVLTYIVFILLNKGKGWVAIKYYLIWVLTVLLVAMVWFGLEIWQHGWWFVNEFFTYQVRLAKTEDAGHGGFPLYHFVVILLGCFPASILFLDFT